MGRISFVVLVWCTYTALYQKMEIFFAPTAASQQQPSEIARCQSLANIMACQKHKFRGQLMMDYGFALPVFLFDTLFILPIISISKKMTYDNDMIDNNH